MSIQQMYAIILLLTVTWFYVKKKCKLKEPFFTVGSKPLV